MFVIYTSYNSNNNNYPYLHNNYSQFFYKYSFFFPYLSTFFPLLVLPLFPPSSPIFSRSRSDFTAEPFQYTVWLQPCVCAAEWPLRAPVSDVALSMRRMSLTSVQLLSERVAPHPLTPHRGRETETQKRRLKDEKSERQKKQGSG